MTIDEAYRFVKNEKTNVSKPGLSRIHKILRLLDNPEKNMKIIHVVGTNGKGSVTAMLSAVLVCAGYKVGSMSSPALRGLKDYYRIQLQQIDDDAYIDAVNALQVVCGALPEEEYPTEFEMSVIIGIILFQRADCEYIVLEAGMGGAKDATHLETPGILTVISHIAKDHMQYLGDTEEEILKEKVAISAPGETVVLGINSNAIRRICDMYCFEHGNPFLYAGDSVIPFSKESLNAKLSLPGLYQQENAKTVCAAVYALRQLDVYISNDAIRNGLSIAMLPFRFQFRSLKPYFIMDGGHNPDCIRALTESLAVLPDSPKFIIVTGVMADKDYTAMYPLLVPYAESFITVTPNNSRALPAKKLKKYLESLGVKAEATSSIEKAGETIAEYFRSGKNVLCTGTLYMMSDLEKAIKETGLQI